MKITKTLYAKSRTEWRKWLKDRKSHTLTNSEIEQYQKIIVALSETERIMREIDPVKFV